MVLNKLLRFPKRLGRFAILLALALVLFLLLPIVLLTTTGWRLDTAAKWVSPLVEKPPYQKIEVPFLLLRWNWDDGLHLRGQRIHAELDDGSSLSIGKLHIAWDKQRIRDICVLPSRINLEGLSVSLREDSSGQRHWLPAAEPKPTDHHPQPPDWPLDNLPSWVWPADTHPIDILLTQSRFEWDLPSIGATNHIAIPEFQLSTQQDSSGFSAVLSAGLDASPSKVNGSVKLEWDSATRIVSIETSHDTLTLEFLTGLLPPAVVPVDFRVEGGFATSLIAKLHLGETPQPLLLHARWQSDDWLIDSPQWLPEPVLLKGIDWSLNIDWTKGLLSTSALNISLPWTNIEIDPLSIGYAQPFSANLQIKGELPDINEWLDCVPDEIKKSIPLEPADLRQLGIGFHHIRAEVAFKPWVPQQFPELNLLYLVAETEIQIAEDKIALKLDTQFDAQELTWTAALHTGPMHPFLWRSLSINDGLPIDLTDLDFSTSINLNATGSIQDGIESITVAAQIPSGLVHGLIDTAQPLPINDLQLFLTAKPAALELLELNASGNLCGVDFKISNVKGKLAGEDVEFQAQLQLANFNIAELFPYLPNELANNEALAQLNPDGRVSEIQIGVTLGGNMHLLDSNPLSLLQQIQLNARMDKLSLKLTPELSAHIDSISIVGDLNEITVRLPRIDIEELSILNTSIRIDKPLDSIPQLTLSTSSTLNLANLHSMLEHLPLDSDPATLAPISDLKGYLYTAANISVPVETPPDPTHWRMALNVELNELYLPRQWAPFQQGSATLQTRAEWQGESASLNGSLQVAEMNFEPWMEGPMGFNFAMNSDAEHALDGWLQIDLHQAGIAIEPLKLTKTMGETADFKVYFSASPIINTEEISIQSRVHYDLWNTGTFAFHAAIDPSGSSGLYGIQNARIWDLDILGNQLELQAIFTNIQSRIQLISAEINLPKALESLSPIVYDFLLAMDHADDSQSPTSAHHAPPPEPVDFASLPEPLQSIYGSFHIEKLILSPENTLSTTSGEIIISNYSLQQANIRGYAEGREILQLETQQQPGGKFNINLSLPDAAGLANMLVSPLLLLDLPDSPTGNNLDVVRRVPDSFVGGRLLLEGILHLDQEIPGLEGKFSCIDLYMVKAPCLLRIVAATSGKGFSEKVAFRTFEIDYFSVDAENLKLEKLKFEGPFSMNIEHGSYRFSDQFIHVKGDHFLTNFEIEGPILGPPKVYLDNRATRWMGTDESDWSGM